MIQSSRRRTAIHPATRPDIQPSDALGQPASQPRQPCGASSRSHASTHSKVCSRKHVHATTSMQSTGRQAGRQVSSRRQEPPGTAHTQLKMSMVYRFVRSSPHSHTRSHRHMQSLTQMDGSVKPLSYGEGGKEAHPPRPAHGRSDMAIKQSFKLARRSAPHPPYNQLMWSGLSSDTLHLRVCSRRSIPCRGSRRRPCAARISR
mmetsp:Transcript_25512/g.63199  ORF Transcript_25512/g.63199 Transcript_25512/m.63199 type:complete len:203 (-) Transcript_25512:428-1036(-)